MIAQRLVNSWERLLSFPRTTDRTCIVRTCGFEDACTRESAFNETRFSFLDEGQSCHADYRLDRLYRRIYPREPALQSATSGGPATDSRATVHRHPHPCASGIARNDGSHAASHYGAGDSRAGIYGDAANDCCPSLHTGNEQQLQCTARSTSHILLPARTPPQRNGLRTELTLRLLDSAPGNPPLGASA
jgi:hypothetical protein